MGRTDLALQGGVGEPPQVPPPGDPMNSRRETIGIAGNSIEVDVFDIQGKDVVVEGTFFRVARLKDEMADVISEPRAFIQHLKESGLKADILTFWPRVPEPALDYGYAYEDRIQALLPISDFDHWWSRQVHKNTRNRIRHAKAVGVEVRSVPLDADLVKAIKRIYDETPIRRNQAFWHYGKSIGQLTEELERDLDGGNVEFLVAYHDDEVIGFMKMIYRPPFGDPVLFLSSTRHAAKCPSNALMARAVEACALRKLRYIHYSDWRLGTHGDFLRRNGFEPVAVRRYYVPLTLRGKVYVQGRLYVRVRERLPEGARVFLATCRGSLMRLRSRLFQRPMRREISPRTGR
jgi:hypothetical protein